MQQNSIQQLLSTATKSLQNSPSSELDTEILLAHVLKKNRSFLRAWPEKQLSEQQQLKFENLIAERKNGTPIAYILGEKEFWSHTFLVDKHVLIPRPDTELLIDIALETLSPRIPTNIADLGTGSGAIAISLALERPQSTIVAVDISAEALAIAKKNAAQLQANNIKFQLSHWLEGLSNSSFDIIISNPPYIESTDPHLLTGDVQFEPKTALVSNENGLHDIKMIIHQAPKFLKPKGFILFEHGFQQGKKVQSLLESANFVNIKQFRDLQGHMRATLAQYNHL